MTLLPPRHHTLVPYREWFSNGIAWRAGCDLPAGRPRTLPELLATRPACALTTPALINDDGTPWTWPALTTAACRLAAAWHGTLRPGDRVALVLGNGAAHLLSELACWHLGAVPVPIFAGMPGERLRAALRTAAPALVVHAQHQAPPDPAARSWSDTEILAATERPGPTPPVHAPTPDEPCLLLFTSGSTGHPRAVILSHDNLCSQQAAFAALWPTVGPGDRLASYLPWHHSFGALAERLWALCRGATVHLVPGGGRDPAALVTCVRRVRPTIFMSVPKVLPALCAADAFDRTCLRWLFTAGAPIGINEERWFAQRGIRVLEGWGMTECSPSATITPLDAPRRHGVVGQPIPGVQVGVRANDGHVLVAGPGVMHGYFRDPTASAAVLHDGILDTGDLGLWEGEGLLLHGRADHMCKLANGEKVPVPRLEAELESLPAIDHAVIAVGEVVEAILHACETIADSHLRDAIATWNQSQMLPFLRIARTWRLERPPTVDNGLLTSSHKLARPAVLALLANHRAYGCGPLRML